MAKPLTSWLVPCFSQHNLRLVVSRRCLHVSVTKFQDKFASLQQVNSPYSWNKFQIMLYRHVFDKISTEFRGIFRVFVNFADLPEFRGCTTARNIRSPVIYKYQYLQCCKEHFCGSSGWNNFNSLAVLSNFHPGELYLPQDNAGKWHLYTLWVKQHLEEVWCTYLLDHQKVLHSQ